MLEQHIGSLAAIIIVVGATWGQQACGSDTTNDTENPPGDGDSDEATHSALDA